MDEEYNSSYAPGDYKLRAWVDGEDRLAEELQLKITNPNYIAGLTLDPTDAVDLAVRILEQFAPERLAEPKFGELPVGTFMRRHLDGKIAQVINVPDNQDYRDLDDDCNWVSFDDGLEFVAVQDRAKPAWEILSADQVEVQQTEQWVFKG